MQQRRFRPGDVLDDYCPRERRITDHAIVAMIDDHIKQTRCVVCDAEHEYKDGKVPPQRRKKPQAALFTPGARRPAGAAAARLASTFQTTNPSDQTRIDAVADEAPDASLSRRRACCGRDAVPADGRQWPGQPVRPRRPRDRAGNGGPADSGPPPTATRAARRMRRHPPATTICRMPTRLRSCRDDGPVRRPLIRATLPRPEGQPVQPDARDARVHHPPADGRTHQSPRRPAPRPASAAGAPGPMRSDAARTASAPRAAWHGARRRSGPPRRSGRTGGPNGNRGGQRRGGKKRCARSSDGRSSSAQSSTSGSSTADARLVRRQRTNAESAIGQFVQRMAMSLSRARSASSSASPTSVRCRGRSRRRPRQAGATLVLTYQGRFEEHVGELADTLTPRAARPAARRAERRRDRRGVRAHPAGARRARLPRPRRRVRQPRRHHQSVRADLARRASGSRSTSAPTR